MRHIKSPFSYVEMITFAIVSNPNTMMTLQNITNFMPKAFCCLRGGYEGWKNSVRHTLSINDCFKKVLRRPDRPSGKDNFWIMNVDCKHCKSSGMENDWKYLKLRYQQYVQEFMVDSSGVQLKSPPNVRFDNNQKTKSPQAAVSPVRFVYHQVEYPRHMLMPYENSVHAVNQSKIQSVSYPMDLSTKSHDSRKRQSLDDEPLDLSVKRQKTSPSTSATTGQYEFIQRSSLNGSCSPDSCSPQLVSHNKYRTSIPEQFSSKLHCPLNANRTRFLKNMTGRMHVYDQDRRIRMVQNFAGARRPIYILSNISGQVHSAEGY
ncbi:forkhead box protein A2-A-like [Anneissia japonica]|uniref:forkhead box protein A2-A-like n=1 Tax=Anneissia japonica TaxID=1529436 RepID=UPI0014256022|nr:forkhead box protein A2-A-like [Anneissia japonica]